MSQSTTTIPKGSWILVTGATGFIASHVASEFLKRGYKVRGTARDLSKAKWLTEELFPSEASKGEFEIAAVPNMSLDGAFDEAVKGVSAVAHVATINSLDADPNNVIPQTIAGALNVLRAASKEKSITQFVFTSSAGAAIMPVADVAFHCDSTSWNDAVVDLAWAPPPYEPSRALITYMASKVEAEKAVWKFVTDNKPHFTVNTVLPYTTFGKILSKHQPGSTAAMIVQLYNGNGDIPPIPAMNYINVRDVALMHVAAILDPDVKNARIHAWARPFDWNYILAILRKLYPRKRFIDDLPNLGKMLGTVDDTLGLKLMKKWAGQDGWTPLEQGVKENLEGVE